MAGIPHRADALSRGQRKELSPEVELFGQIEALTPSADTETIPLQQSWGQVFLQAARQIKRERSQPVG